MITIRERLTRESALIFARNLLQEARAASLPVDPMSVDHLCFRVATMDEYQSACELVTSGEAVQLRGALLTESMVNGRPISAFKLTDPLILEDQMIPVIEIPAPKPSRPHLTGFEHIEVVTPLSFAELRHLLPSLIFEELSSGTAANPELVWQSPHGAVKFHHQSLESVIEREKKESLS